MLMLSMSKNKQTQNSDQPDVDMNKIKDMMGPLPDEPMTKASASAEVVSKDESLAEAAQEANEALRKMDPKLGESEIKKIDEPEETNIVDLTTEKDDEEKMIVAGNSKDESETLNVIEDPKTDEAVESIVEEESDVILKVEDEKNKPELQRTKNPKVGLRARLRNFWSVKRNRWIVLGLFLAIIAILSIVPVSRYFVLNTVGVRSGLSVKVVDGSTLLPLKNVEVSVGSISAKTDDNGIGKLSNLKLGSSKLIISKRAFATFENNLVIGLGSNPMGDVSLKATGSQYIFIVQDYLSGKPIEGVNATSGEANSKSDKDGRIKLTVDNENKENDDLFTVELSLDGLRTEKVDLKVSSTEENTVKMVSSRKHVYVSKRSGKYDVYSVDIDGKNDKKLVAGTGLERSDILLLPDRSGSYVAYVSTRENVKNGDGYLMSTLYLIDVSEGELVKIDQSEQFQLIGWSNDSRLAYLKTVAGASAANPNRVKIISVNSNKVSDKKDLVSANYFNDAVSFAGKVYYAPGNESQVNPKPGLYSINYDGTSRATIFDKSVWNIFRSSYDGLTINSNNTWYAHKQGTSTATAGATATSTNRLYIDSNDQKNSSWVDQRDGKGVLLNYEVAKSTDKQLVSKVGLKTPLYYLNSKIIVYRVSDNKEIADYAVSIDGGEPKKLASVTDTMTIGSWFSY